MIAELWIRRMTVAMALVSSLASFSLWHNWRNTHRPELLEQNRSATELQSAWAREREFQRANHSFTSDLKDAGISPVNSLGWGVSAVSSRVNERPILMLEAEGPKSRLMADAQGKLYVSELRSLPPIPPWLAMDSNEPRLSVRKQD